ncbi:MAG: HD-GYP domain-containing protein [Nitrospirae bacterium]|nr:HD-GYP domain-containing protein [Nitrospirota bacterium]
MANITDYMPDTAFLEQMIDFLNKSNGISACVLDSEGRTVEVNPDFAVRNPQLAVKKFYPFDFTENIGGLMCTADSEKLIVDAEALISLQITAINTLLQREIEIGQMSSEIIGLSEQINFLSQLTKKMRGINSLRDFCELTVHEISKKIKADYGFISVKPSDSDDLTITYNLSKEEAQRMLAEDIFSIAAKKEDSVLSTLKDGVSVIASPVNVKDGSIGSVAFFRRPDKRFFTAYEKKFAAIIDKSISSAVEILRLYDNLKGLYLNTVKALAAAIDAKDPYTHGHSFRVARYSMDIAKKLNLPEDAVSDIEIAAYLHDVGKIGIPGEVLRKKGKLTDSEYSTIKKHPLFTWKILQPIKLSEFITNAAVHHHERLDGKGYPFGLSADKISVPARITAVADVFDALTSERPYRKAMPLEESVDILYTDIDKAFDRNVVSALIDILKDSIAAGELSVVYPELRFEDLGKLSRFLDVIKEQIMQSPSVDVR